MCAKYCSSIDRDERRAYLYKELNGLDDLSELPGVLEAFPWYYEIVMKAMAGIGGSASYLLEFFVYESIGYSVGNMKGLEHVNFS
jgi:hypothetical protein